MSDEDPCNVEAGSSRTCERGARGCNVKHCKTCLDVKYIDDRGFPLTGQPFFESQPCPECNGGTGKSLAMRIAEAEAKEDPRDVEIRKLRAELARVQPVVDVVQRWVDGGCWSSGIPEVRDAVRAMPKVSK